MRLAYRLAGKIGGIPATISGIVQLGSEPSNPYDFSAEDWTPLELDAWIIANSTLTGETIILPGVSRSYYSTSAYTTLAANNDVTYAGSTLADTDAIIDYLILQGDSETGVEGDIYWNNSFNFTGYDATTYTDTSTEITTIEDRENSIIGLTYPAPLLTFIGASTPVSSLYSSSITVEVPAGTLQGHTMIAVVSINNSGSPITPPSGWSLDNSYSVALPSATMHILTKVASASEPASYTFNGWASARVSASILTYANVHADIYDVATNISSSGSTSDTTITSASLTTITNNAMLIFAFCVDDSNVRTVNTPPSGMTEREALSDFTYQGLSVYDQLIVTAGATGTRTAILDSAITDIFATIALKPA